MRIKNENPDGVVIVIWMMKMAHLNQLEELLILRRVLKFQSWHRFLVRIILIIILFKIYRESP